MVNSTTSPRKKKLKANRTSLASTSDLPVEQNNKQGASTIGLDKRFHKPTANLKTEHQHHQRKKLEEETNKATLVDSDSDEDVEQQGSEIQVTRAVSKVAKSGLFPKDSADSILSSGSSSSTSFGSESLDSSLDKFRDDFDDFKCKMRVFGESLQLCKCIANDFRVRLKYVENKLTLLERRQKRNMTRHNYTEIIQKNKQLESKTKEFVQKLQKCGTEEEMREVVGRICKNYLHGLWKIAQPKELKFRKVSGGLSNFIYVIGLPDDLRHLYERLSEMDDEEVKAMEVGDEPKQVLLRIYGQVHGERAMDAIVTESVIFTLLSERRLGPKLFGVFSGGRIEEFIPARPLLTRELAEPAISMKIAEKTAAIHSMEIPLSKEPNFIWKTMYKWLRTVKDECFNTGIKGKNETEQNAIKRLKEVNYDNEIDWLKKYLIGFDSPVVFCHNDLQEGNILLLEDGAGPDYYDNEEYEEPTYGREQRSESKVEEKKEEDQPSSPPPRTGSWIVNSPQSHSNAAFMSANRLLRSQLDMDNDDTSLSEPSGEPKLYLIDFEYCAYNYRAFDIANHFQEWAYDYTNSEPPFYHERQDDWPTIEQKEIFIREYLKYYAANTSEDKQPVSPDIDSVNKLLAEVEAFALASHLFWTLWSIVNASKSQIPFGYWEYGISRLDSYQRMKQEVIKKEQLGLPQKRKIEEVDI